MSKTDLAADTTNNGIKNPHSNDDAFGNRAILAQVLASLVNALQFFSLGAAIAYGSVVVAGLTSTQDVIEASIEELSWLGSICFVFQATGNLVGGTMSGLLGRKRCMLLGNIPYLIAWITMWQSASYPVLMVAMALLGLGTGVLSAPMTSYVGEICKPSMRGVMTSSSELFVAIGLCYAYFVGTILSWRTTAAFCLVVAILSELFLFFIPESPIWLLSKGREEQSLKALCWLRGWVKPAIVQTEFDWWKQYDRHNKRCKKCESTGINDLENPGLCKHSETSLWERIKALLLEFSRREMWKPLVLSGAFFMFSAMTSFYSMRPTMNNLLRAYNTPIDASWGLAGVGIIQVLGALVIMSLVKVMGKRKMALSCMLGSCIATILLGLYAQYYIPPETSTFNDDYIPNGETSVIPLILFILLISFNVVGIITIPWMIISEIFPYNMRGIASGLVAAFGDLILFFSVKTYLSLETNLHIYGMFYFYSGFTFIGLIFLYLFLIETENRDHAEIEAAFADKHTVCFANDLIARKIKDALKKRTTKITAKPIDLGHDNIGYNKTDETTG